MADVFVVGDLNVDIHCHVSEAPCKGKEVHAEPVRFSLGGNAANFAVALSRLGVDTEFHSCIGKDMSSRFLKQELEQSGVKTRLMENDEPNGLTVALVYGDGSRGFISNKGSSARLTVKDLRPILKDLAPGKILYIGGFFHLPSLSKGFPAFLKEAKRKGATIMFDFSYDETGASRGFRDFASHLDMVFLNEDELNMLQDKIKGSSKKMSRLGVRDVIVKLGRRGSVFYTNGMITREPAEKVKAVDTTGAGDVFNAAFVYGYMRGLLPEQCLALGNWVAGHHVAKPGLSLPDRDRVHGFVKKLE